MRKIVSVVLVLAICIGLLCGCSHTINEKGVEVVGEGRYVFLERIDNGDNVWISYDKETKIVCLYDDSGYNTGFRGYYYIYENGAIYGSIYENGEIKPVPFATVVP